MKNGCKEVSARGSSRWLSPPRKCLEVAGSALEIVGQRALSGSGDRTLKLWDLPAGTLLQRTLEDDTGRVTAVTVLPDGQRAFSRSYDGTRK